MVFFNAPQYDRIRKEIDENFLGKKMMIETCHNRELEGDYIKIPPIEVSVSKIEEAVKSA